MKNIIRVGKEKNVKTPTQWTKDISFHLNNIRDIPVPTAEEEVELFQDIRSGNEEKAIAARNRLIEGHQRFIFSIAKSYAKGNDILELVQEGNIGLIEAIDKFNPTVGTRFLTYANWYARRQIVDYITNKSIMVRSSNKAKLLGVMPKLREEFYQTYERYPSPEELIDLINEKGDIKIKNVHDLYDVDISSIDETYLDNEKKPTPAQAAFLGATSNENEYEREIEKDNATAMANKFLQLCTEEERNVLKLLFGIGCDYAYSEDMVAQELDIDPIKVKKIKNKALKKMKKVALANAK